MHQLESIVFCYWMFLISILFFNVNATLLYQQANHLFALCWTVTFCISAIRTFFTIFTNVNLLLLSLYVSNLLYYLKLGNIAICIENKKYIFIYHYHMTKNQKWDPWLMISFYLWICELVLRLNQIFYFLNFFINKSKE